MPNVDSIELKNLWSYAHHMGLTESRNGKFFGIIKGGYFHIENSFTSQLPDFALHPNTIKQLNSYWRCGYNKTSLSIKGKNLVLESGDLTTIVPIVDGESFPVDEVFLTPLMTHNYHIQVDTASLWGYVCSIPEDDNPSVDITITDNKLKLSFTTTSNGYQTNYVKELSSSNAPKNWSSKVLVKALTTALHRHDEVAEITFTDNTKTSLSHVLVKPKTDTISVLSSIW